MNLVRTSERAFHPHGRQRILTTAPEVFTVLRSSPEEDQHILAMTNVSDRPQRLEIDETDLGVVAGNWHELLNDRHLQTGNGRLKIELQPYDVLWLKPS
jgi:sucrose phosphorylase